MAEPNAQYKRLAEAALFASGRPMSADEVSKAIGVSSIGLVDRLLDELAREYQHADTALFISKTGSKYTMGLREPYASKLGGLAGRPELSKGALRTLAYISKNEPVLQSQIVKALGSSVYGHVHELMDKEFIAAKREGRSRRLTLTQRFMEYFEIRDKE